MILLLVAFGSAIAAGLPLLLALAGIAVGLRRRCTCSAWSTPLSVWSMNFSMMIGLAVGIDYSLFIVSRYREEREDGYDADRRHRQHPVHRGQGRVPVRPHRGAVARRRVRGAGHGVPLDGARHDPVGRRRRARLAHPAARRARRRSATGCWWPRATRTPTAPPRAAGPGGPARRSRHPGRTLARRTRPAAAARRAGDRACASACPAPAWSTRAAPAATATRWWSSPSGPVPRRRCSSPCRPARPSRSSTSPRPTPTSSTPGSWPSRPPSGAPSCGSPPPPRSTPRRPPTWSAGCAPTIGAAVPDAAGRRPGRPEPRPHRRAHRPGAAGHRPHHGRGVRAAARRVPQPHHRPVVDPAEPDQRRRQLRVRHPRVPARHRRRPHRHRAPGLRRRLGAAVLLRPAVRPVDGLPAVPAGRDPGALRGHRRHADSPSARASPAPAGPSPTPRSS